MLRFASVRGMLGELVGSVSATESCPRANKLRFPSSGLCLQGSDFRRKTSNVFLARPIAVTLILLRNAF